MPRKPTETTRGVQREAPAVTKGEPQPTESNIPSITDTKSPASGVASPQPPAFTPKVEKSDSDRITFKIIDGKIDFESLQARTVGRAQEVLKNSFADPAVLSFAGIAPTQAAALTTGTVVTADDAKYILDFEASLVTTAMGLKFKLPLAEVKSIMGWKEAEHEILDERCAKVMTKYLPEDFKQSMDWILFLGSFLTMTMLKISMVAQLAKQKETHGKTSAPVEMTPKENAAAPVAEQAA